MTTEPVAIVGAGPVGMTLALELARSAVPSVLLDAKPQLVREGSKAIVLARHALETWDRLGCAKPMLAKGVVLARARTYFRTTELFCVDFPPAAPGDIPRFINLQQKYTERVLLDAVERSGAVDVRWSARVAGLRPDADGVTLELEPAGRVHAPWVVACDGAHSTVRKLAGVDFPGRSFDDRFLIADVRAEMRFPRDERRFFFDPPQNRGRTMLVHPQPDDEWRIDWQVPVETDAEGERRSGRLDRRIEEVVGHRDYELAWLTAYRFHQRLAARFRAGRVFLAGDAAHLFSPFGARGMNSGVEDARNLGWKLALVTAGKAGEPLLDSYEVERRPAAAVNLRVTGETMRFMAPPTPAHRLVRDAVLRGSLRSERLRRRVNSGKLAEPAVYGPGPVGRLAPNGVDSEPVGDGFGLVRTPHGNLLVRPDGYVAARVDGTGGVGAALDAVLAR